LLFFAHFGKSLGFSAFGFYLVNLVLKHATNHTPKRCVQFKKMKNLLTFTFLILLFSCDSKVDGFFYISNGSRDQSKIPLRLIVDNDTIFDQDAKYTNIAPDLQYIENKKLTKGKHQIIFEVTNSELKRIESVEFDEDKWIFLSYGFKKPADSIRKAELDKIFGGIRDSTNLFLYEGRKPSLTFHIMDKEPIHH